VRDTSLSTKIDGTCPRCGKREVRRSPERRLASQRRAIVVTAFSATRLVTYVCTACGYVEDRVEDRAVLDRIKERWIHLR